MKNIRSFLFSLLVGFNLWIFVQFPIEVKFVDPIDSYLVAWTASYMPPPCWWCEHSADVISAELGQSHRFVGYNVRTYLATSPIIMPKDCGNRHCLVSGVNLNCGRLTGPEFQVGK